MSDSLATEPATHLPTQLTSFVGRQAELTEVRGLVSGHRLVTLTGTGGVGKTRLAVHLAADLADRFGDGVWWVDLAPIVDPDLVAVRAARTLGLPDQPGRSAGETLARFIAEGRMLIVLDNCEHQLDACARLLTALLGTCPKLTVVATSREPIRVSGEVTWRTPPLSLADDAIELFGQRARLARPDLDITQTAASTIAEICRRLDGLPLAIELAAARVRVLSLNEIAVGLRDRFPVLAGGDRLGQPRQQTLRASVDWSYDLLAEYERVVFHRLAVFAGGFDLDAAIAIGVEPSQNSTVDAVSLLAEKSLLVVDTSGPSTRYHFLETVRHYALEKLAESGEADAVRTRHRDHYLALFDVPVSGDIRDLLARAEAEIDNLRAAFAWSRECGDHEAAAQLVCALQPLWLGRRVTEGLAWLDAVLADGGALAPATRACALADKTVLDWLAGDFGRMDQIAPALAIGRDLGDPRLLARVLTAAGATWLLNAETAQPYFNEAIDLARTSGDDYRLSQALGLSAYCTLLAGDPTAARVAAEEGCGLAAAAGDAFIARLGRWVLGLARWNTADLVGAVASLRHVVADAHASHEPLWTASGQFALSYALAYQGDTSGAHVAADAAIAAAADLTGLQRALGLGALAYAALAAGDLAAAATAGNAAWEACPSPQLLATHAYPMAEIALATGDVDAARRWADDAVAVASAAHLVPTLTTRARVAMTQGDVGQAERDAHQALAVAAETRAFLTVPNALECLAALSAGSGDHRDAARLFGAARSIRERTGEVRFKVHENAYQTALALPSKALAEQDFDAAWTAGAGLSTPEAIAYALRGRGPRKRPDSGWDALTPREIDVARLVSEGLGNSAIATRLLVSADTVKTHLTHVYSKLGVTNRVQLTREVARRG